MDDLVGSILERTSGSPCPRAREGLAERGLGQAADPVGEELLRAHLETCEQCAALSRVLAGLEETLPLLAEIEPGEEFTAQVLARTPPRRTCICLSSTCAVNEMSRFRFRRALKVAPDSASARFSPSQRRSTSMSS